MPARLHPDVAAAQYHSESFVVHPHLSGSVASTLVNRSPYHAWLEHPKFGKLKKEPTAQMDWGAVVHALVLDKGLEQIAVLGHDNFKSKAAQGERDLAREGGFVPICEPTYDRAKIVALAIIKAINEAGFALEEYDREQVITWEEETAFGNISCRGMIDLLHPNCPYILDLKTIGEATHDSIRRSIETHRYDLKQTAYRSALNKLRPDSIGREDFAWLFVEELPEGSPEPIALVVARPDGPMRELGQRLWQKACNRFAQCIATDHWPVYDSGITIESSPWSLRQMEATI